MRPRPKVYRHGRRAGPATELYVIASHFMDRDNQVLADVTPRRYFCTACHVLQTDAPPLVPNRFEDMLVVKP